MNRDPGRHRQPRGVSREAADLGTSAGELPGESSTDIARSPRHEDRTGRRDGLSAHPESAEA